MQSGLAHGCFLCGARHHGTLLCDGCAADLPLLPDKRCPICAQPTSDGSICGACIRHPAAYDRVVAAYRYDFPTSVLIQQLKYAGQLAIAPWLAERLAQAVDPADLPDLLIPMPLHERRLKERGFNQASLIGGRLASTFGVAIDHAACRRIRATRPQAELPIKARRGNLRGAFACDRDLSGLHVALVDDVMTSGASLEALAKAVRKRGAARVSAWVVARALK
jgi:ComF family protein